MIYTQKNYFDASVLLVAAVTMRLEHTIVRSSVASAGHLAAE